MRVPQDDRPIEVRCWSVPAGAQRGAVPTYSGERSFIGRYSDQTIQTETTLAHGLELSQDAYETVYEIGYTHAFNERVEDIFLGQHHDAQDAPE